MKNQIITPNTLVAPGDAGEPTPFLRYYGLMFWRWRKVVAGIVVAFLALGVVITLLMTPQFTATSQIEIMRDSAQIVNMQGVEQATSDADQEFYQTQYGLLQSQSLAERIATNLGLVDDPAFFEMFDEAEDLFSDTAGSRTPTSDRNQRVRVAGDILLEQARISPERESRLVNINFTSPDPVLSQKVANAWAEQFILINLERRYESSSYAREFLEGRLAELKESLDESERALQGYAQAQRIITLPGQGQSGSEQSTVAYDLVALSSELASATGARVAAQARLESVRGRAGESQESLDNATLNQLRSERAKLEAEYEKLLTQFEPAYPPAQALRNQIDDLEASIRREERRVGGAVEVAFNAAKQREADLAARVAAVEAEFLDQRARSIDYRVLGRDVDTNRQLYDALLQRYKEIGIAGGVGTNNISIVDEAQLPLRPSSPQLLLNMLIALVGGLALGGIAAFLLDQSDETLADPSDIEGLVGLPLLGSVPKLADEEPRESVLDPKSTIVDAYLAVQTSLQFSTESGVPRSFAVTSTRPGEGKSTTALVLATLLARSQKRVVLVDGDMRSPSVHHLIDAGHEKGLSTYLSGNARASELLTPVTRYGFQAMTAGPIPPNAAELLTGGRLSDLLQELAEDFDHVVIDAPPVMGLADVPLIAGRVEGVIYAVEAHGIRMGMVRTALQRLVSSNARILGVVVTKFEPKKSAKGYGYTYGYDYGDTEVKKRSKSHDFA
jgi:polysaccharide biosynthesis transport protein